MLGMLSPDKQQSAKGDPLPDPLISRDAEYKKPTSDLFRTKKIRKP